MPSKISPLSRWSMLLGNMFEHYDAALFSLLSPLLAPLFFPGQDPITALILTYCIIPLGMAARPIGSLIFGYIGDTKGRKKALVITLTGMAIVTASMGLLPTYQQVGFLAPVLLSLGRILQNFFAAGETVGGALFLIENVPEREKDMTSSFYNSSTIAGILTASFGVSLLCGLNLVQECWRVLYFCGCFTACFALFLRTKMRIEPSEKTSEPFSLNYVLQTCWEYRKALSIIAVASGFSYASYTVALIMMNGFVPLVTTITTEEMMHLNTILLIFDFMMLPLFGYLTTRYSREKMMMGAGIAASLTGIPLFWFLQGASLATVIGIRFALVIIGVWFSAPFYSWAQQLVPASHRYTVISFAYAIGSQLLGGPSAAISLWLFQKSGWAGSAGIFWMVLGLLTSFCISTQIVRSSSKQQTIQDI